MNGPSNTAAAPPRKLGTPPPNAPRQEVTRFQALVASCSARGWETRLRDRLVQAPGPFKGQSKAAEEFVKTYSRAPAAERAFLWLQFDLAQPECPSTAQELGARLVDFALHPYARSGGVEHLAAEVTRRTRDTGEFTEVVHRTYDAARQDGLPATQYGPLLHGVARGVLEAGTPDQATRVPGHARTLATLLLEPATDPQAHWPCIHTGLSQLVDVCTGKAPPVAGAVAAVVACLDEALAKELAADRRRDLKQLRDRFPARELVKPQAWVERRKPVVVPQPEPERRPLPPLESPISPPEIDRKHGFGPAPDLTSRDASDLENGVDPDPDVAPAHESDSGHEIAPAAEQEPAADPEHASALSHSSNRKSEHQPAPSVESEYNSDSDSEQESAPHSDADFEWSRHWPRADSKGDSDSDSDSPARLTWHPHPAPPKPSTNLSLARARTLRVRAREAAHPALPAARPESKQPALPAAVPARVPEPVRPQAPPPPAAKPEPQDLHHLTPELAQSLWLNGEFQPGRLPSGEVLEQHDAHYLGAYLAGKAPGIKMTQIAMQMWSRSQGMKQSPAEWLGRFYAGWVEAWAPGANILELLRAEHISKTVFDNFKRLAPKRPAKNLPASGTLDLPFVTCLDAVAKKLSRSSGSAISKKIAKALPGHMPPEAFQLHFLDTVRSAEEARAAAAGGSRPVRHSR